MDEKYDYINKVLNKFKLKKPNNFSNLTTLTKESDRNVKKNKK